MALPDALDREAVERAVHELPTTEVGARSAFVAAMAWGYGGNAYGPARAARVLEGTADAPARLRRATKVLRSGGALAAYAQLARAERIKYLGPSFGTKFLFFQSGGDERALILDDLIGQWLRANTPLNPVTSRWAPSSYERYLVCMRAWAAACGVDAATLEAILFTEQADIGGGQWAGSRSAETLRLGFRGNPRSERGTMADAITRACEAVEGRIQEIEAEMKRLRAALAELVEGERRPTKRHDGSSSGRSSPRSSPASRRRRKVAPRGQRREQLLAHLEKNPGAKPADIAREMGTTPANVQNVLRKAREDKLVRRRTGGGYALTSRPGSRSPAPAAASTQSPTG